MAASRSLPSPSTIGHLLGCTPPRRRICWGSALSPGTNLPWNKCEAFSLKKTSLETPKAKHLQEFKWCHISDWGRTDCGLPLPRHQPRVVQAYRGSECYQCSSPEPWDVTINTTKDSMSKAWLCTECLPPSRSILFTSCECRDSTHVASDLSNFFAQNHRNLLSPKSRMCSQGVSALFTLLM